MKNLKVWGGNLFVRGKQMAAVVATATKTQAATLLGVSYNHFRECWQETGNEKSLEAALSKPGVVFVSEMLNYEYQELTEYRAKLDKEKLNGTNSR